MTHTHECTSPAFDIDGVDVFIQCWKCGFVIEVDEAEKRIDACAGVTLGERASVKRLVKAIAAMDEDSQITHVRNDVYDEFRRAPAPFEVE